MISAKPCPLLVAGGCRECDIWSVTAWDDLTLERHADGTWKLMFKKVRGPLYRNTSYMALQQARRDELDGMRRRESVSTLGCWDG